jgi:drug/metabolite transporter (DMT)-like permease
MMAAVLALASSLSWGLADFLGGLQSRRQPLLTVLVLSQGVALLLLLVVILGGAPTGHDTAATLLAAGSGVVGLLGLAAFYRALATGTMSIVAPVTATGTAVPVFAGIVSGERPGALQIAGIVLAVCGVVLASRAAPPEGEAQPRGGRTPIALALLAAVCFGSFLVGIDRAEESGDVAWILLATRVADLLILVPLALVNRPPLPPDRQAWAGIVAIGVFDMLANLLFVLAVGRGLLSVVGVLGTLYPAVTVLLARMILHERLSRTQGAGVLVTLVGVAALAAG